MAEQKIFETTNRVNLHIKDSVIKVFGPKFFSDSMSRDLAETILNNNPSQQWMLRYTDNAKAKGEMILVTRTSEEAFLHSPIPSQTWSNLLNGQEADDKKVLTKDNLNRKLDGMLKAVDEIRKATITHYADYYSDDKENSAVPYEFLDPPSVVQSILGQGPKSTQPGVLTIPQMKDKLKGLDGYFKNNFDKNTAVNDLKDKEVGSWLLRPSSKEGHIVISIHLEDGVIHEQLVTDGFLTGLFSGQSSIELFGEHAPSYSSLATVTADLQKKLGLESILQQKTSDDKPGYGFLAITKQSLMSRAPLTIEDMAKQIKTHASYGDYTREDAIKHVREQGVGSWVLRHSSQQGAIAAITIALNDSVYNETLNESRLRDLFAGKNASQIFGNSDVLLPKFSQVDQAIAKIQEDLGIPRKEQGVTIG
jgi:hypothetical protein